MSVTEHLMRLGQWDLTLIPETPKSIRLAVDLFDHVVITAAPIVPLSGVSDANILSAAIYTGVIVEKDEYTLSGFSPLWWLGTDEGVGPPPYGDGGGGVFTVLEPVGFTFTGTWTTNGSQTLAAILAANALGGAVNGVTVGTVNGSGLVNVNGSGPVTGTWRELLDFLCGLAGAEYRMRPNFTYDVASAANLFVSTPTVVVTRKDGGPDGNRRGVRGPNLSIKSSGRSITTHVRAYSDPTTIGQADAGTLPKGPDNANAYFVRRTTSTDSGSNVDTVATNLLNLYSTTRDEITLDSAEYAVTRFVVPGDTVYVYDPQAGLFDTANQITYRGETITPIKVRLKQVTWGIETGMGVYLRQTGTPTYVDLTPWVAFEEEGGGIDHGSDDPLAAPEGWVSGDGSGAKQGGDGPPPYRPPQGSPDNFPAPDPAPQGTPGPGGSTTETAPNRQGQG